MTSTETANPFAPGGAAYNFIVEGVKRFGSPEAFAAALAARMAEQNK